MENNFETEVQVGKNKKGFWGTIGNGFKDLTRVKGARQVFTVLGGLVVLMIMFTILNSRFLTWDNTTNLLRQIAPILIIGIGQSFVLITGNIDLSIGSVIGMSDMVVASLIQNGTEVNVVLAMMVSLILCLGIGVLNGQLVSRFKLPPFIATLGTMSICRGVAMAVNNMVSVTNINPSAIEGFKGIYYSGFLGISFAFWIAIALFVAFWLLLSKTRTGRHIYAVGSNIEAAKLSGVDTKKTITTAYIVSAFCAFVVGMITLAGTQIGETYAGESREMFAVAASVIGGVSTLGGQGLLVGTLVGAAVWCVLENGLQFAGANVAIQKIVVGFIVVGAVLADIIVRQTGLRKKKSKKSNVIGTPEAGEERDFPLRR